MQGGIQEIRNFMKLTTIKRYKNNKYFASFLFCGNTVSICPPLNPRKMNRYTKIYSSVKIKPILNDLVQTIHDGQINNKD